MTITVFGANGRSGPSVVEKLIEAGHEVRAAVRNTNRGDAAIRERVGEPAPRVTVIAADVLDAGALSQRLRVHRLRTPRLAGERRSFHRRRALAARRRR